MDVEWGADLKAQRELPKLKDLTSSLGKGNKKTPIFSYSIEDTKDVV